MRCETFINSIDDFVGLALPQAERRQLEEHLKLCASCREELRSLQSLLDTSASLPKSVMPDRDLWPEIEAGIAAAGPQQKYPLRQVTVSDSRNGSSFPPGVARWIWRLVAVAVLGTMLVLAATYLRNRPPAPTPKAAVVPTDLEGAGQNLQTPSSSLTQALTIDPRFKRAATNPPQDDKELAGYIRACQCGASAETLGLIDKAWIVDENMPPLRAREVVSDRLYNLAVENADNFFLHKASLEARSYPVLRMVADLTDRYRMRLALHPNDPVSTYLYAYSLLGNNTPEMIRLMRQLIVEHPEFPWPNLALAEVRGYFSYKDEKQAQSYLQAFMKLCPESPEPTRLLVALGNSDFLADAIRHMRANLAARSDTQSLMLYQELWYLEAMRGATGDEIAKVRQTIKDDLKRLQSLSAEWQRQLATVIRSGYMDIGDRETFRDLIEKDSSESGRWGAVMLEIQEWNTQNPVPLDSAPTEKRAAYWENRLRMSDSWIKRLPEDSSIWIVKLEALAALKSRPESEFLEVATKALALERADAETSELGTHLLPWRSNILKLASLYADQGVLLDQIPALIKEGLAVSEKRNQEAASDLGRDPQWAFVTRRFSDWLEADDAWHSLANAYLRVGKPDNALVALDCIEPGLAEFKSQLAQTQAGARADDDVITAGQRQWMANELAAREKRYAAARAGVAKAGKSS
jgi:hypothetical protein